MSVRMNDIPHGRMPAIAPANINPVERTVEILAASGMTVTALTAVAANSVTIRPGALADRKTRTMIITQDHLLKHLMTEGNRSMVALLLEKYVTGPRKNLSRIKCL